jgi:hypothetical protein
VKARAFSKPALVALPFLAMPFLAMPFATRAMLTPWAQTAAARLDRVAIALELQQAQTPAPLAPLPDAAAVAALDGSIGSSATADAAVPPLVMGLTVPRQRVEQAARAGHRPSGSGAAATSWRPAGLSLSGASGLGVGLRDGDVVTRVGGTPARSVGAVTGAVSAALDARQPAIVAEVWRGRQRIIVTVELPHDEG